MTVQEQRRREHVLWVIAERYRELVDPLNGPGGVPGDGESVPGMPATYTATVREFERMLRQLRSSYGRLTADGYLLTVLGWHLLEWHLKAESSVKYVTRTYRKHGKVRVVLDAMGEPARVPKVTYRRHRDADERLARRAVGWMAANWARGWEPQLPAEIRVGDEEAA